MVIALKIVFWLSAFLVVYPYIVYPLFLLLATKWRSGRKKSANTSFAGTSESDEYAASISVIISAYNEESVIAEKIENALSLDYPGDYEIIVISDGSTDSTAQIVGRYADAHLQVKLIELEDQVGKSIGLNIALPVVEGDIVVFTDANAMYDKNAIIKLTSPFRERSVGYTVGSALYREQDIEAVNDSEGLYWRFELAIKKLESAYSSVVGGDGAIYAIRKKLFIELSPFDISDFVNPMQIIAAGYTGQFVEDALSYESGTEKFSDEFRRKRRIVNRSWGAVRRHIGIFSVRKHARFLFMLVSHKVVRWWSFLLVIISLLSSLFIVLITGSVAYKILFGIIATSLIVAFVGWQLDSAKVKMPRIVYLLYYFYLISIAGILGIADDMRGLNYATWRPVR